jgi:hypothetical protein
VNACKNTEGENKASPNSAGDSRCDVPKPAGETQPPAGPLDEQSLDSVLRDCPL